MKKTVATAPNQPSQDIELSYTEKTAREIEDGRTLSRKANRLHEDAMLEASNGMSDTEEAILDLVLNGTPLPQDVVDRFNNKQLIRAQKPQ